MTQKQNSIKNSITIKLVEGTSKKLNETDNAVYNCYLDTIPFISAGIDIALKDNAKLDTIFGLIENFNVEYDKEIQVISDLKTNTFPESLYGLDFLKIIFPDSITEVAVKLAKKNNVKTESAKKILEIASFVLLHYLKSNKVTKDSSKNYFLNNKNISKTQDKNIINQDDLDKKIIGEIPVEENKIGNGISKKKFLVI